MIQYLFVYLNKNRSGGNEVFNKLNEFHKNSYSIYLLQNSKIKYAIFNLIKLLIKVYQLKNLSKNKILIASDPFLCIAMGIFKIKYIRYVQAIDEIILMNRINNFNYFIFKKIYKFTIYDGYICNSTFVSQYLFNKYNVKSRAVVNPGTNFRYNQNIKKDFDLIFIIRKAPWKNCKFFIDIIQKKYLDKIKILLINFDSVRVGIKESSNLSILGPQSSAKMQDLFNMSKFYISTTINEGYGLPALEAMACRCIPILPNNGGHNDFAYDEINSFLYDLSNKNALINLIKNCISLNISEITKIQVNCETTAKNFSWDNFCKKFYKTIKDSN